MKHPLRYLWGIWGYIVLVPVVILTAFAIVTLNLIFGKKAQTLCLFLSQKVSCNLICWLSLIRVRIHGRDYIKKGKGYVIIGNHNSDYDIFINSTSLPFTNVFCFLSKAELGQVPIFGTIAKNLAVLVDRSSMTSRVKSMRKMKQVLESGKSVWIFAEGTRNKTSQPLLEFKDGAFKLALEMKVPIIVNTLVGIRNINDANYKVDLCPGIVDSYFEEPISTENITGQQIEELKNNVRTLMLNRLESKK